MFRRNLICRRRVVFGKEKKELFLVFSKIQYVINMNQRFSWKKLFRFFLSELLIFAYRMSSDFHEQHEHIFRILVHIFPVFSVCLFMRILMHGFTSPAHDSRFSIWPDTRILLSRWRENSLLFRLF